ncbi:hypothetical protein C5167_012515 [Papaver somniferum]|uniref:Uncharacterized protein n=1 Tax=Papaver somniferum TaxID=3469 RepID=A0A4Y7J1N0_PAPSO|nr:hypothetical protein C5167_012515 [Papaver somniferum]
MCYADDDTNRTFQTCGVSQNLNLKSGRLFESYKGIEEYPGWQSKNNVLDHGGEETQPISSITS